MKHLYAATLFLLNQTAKYGDLPSSVEATNLFKDVHAENQEQGHEDFVPNTPAPGPISVAQATPAIYDPTPAAAKPKPAALTPYSADVQLYNGKRLTLHFNVPATLEGPVNYPCGASASGGAVPVACPVHGPSCRGVSAATDSAPTEGAPTQEPQPAEENEAPYLPKPEDEN